MAEFCSRRLTVPRTEATSLWVGQAHELAETLPAADIVAKLAAAAKASLASVSSRLAKQ